MNPIATPMCKWKVKKNLSILSRRIKRGEFNYPTVEKKLLVNNHASQKRIT